MAHVKKCTFNESKNQALLDMFHFSFDKILNTKLLSNNKLPKWVIKKEPLNTHLNTNKEERNIIYNNALFQLIHTYIYVRIHICMHTYASRYIYLLMLNRVNVLIKEFNISVFITHYLNIKKLNSEFVRDFSLLN